MRRRTRRLASLVGAGLFLLTLAIPVPAAGKEPNFPRYDSRYHNLPEMLAEIRATARAHPGIVQIRSIGKSYKGRDIWAAKISDNVATDENEPEVLVDALHHAREHLSMEQALYFLRLLANGYGHNSTITRLVNTREIWIIFDVNPDGFTYDLAGYPHRVWRKNRQPTPGSRSIGTDLNRNYDYHWGCCGGSSRKPSALMYRGPRPFSAPETRVIRDFVASRVVDGRQQIKLHITLHTNGQLVLWPYGYTKNNIPADMTRLDRNTFATLGRAMAARNGYTAEQSSDLYITDGDEIDWMYGRYRIFSFTWELYPKASSTAQHDHYPPDEVIARQTARNRTAFLYALSMAGCPYAAVGRQQQNCGPLFDDFEINRGWVVNPDGTDTATGGAWSIGAPAAVASDGPKQLATPVSGRYDLVTGAAAGSSPAANDLDGVTTIRSAPVQLPATPGPMTFRYTFAHDAASTAEDWLRVWVEAAGTRTQVFEAAGTAEDVDAAWASARVDLSAFAGQQVRIVIGASDGGADNLVEAAVDDLRIEQP